MPSAPPKTKNQILVPSPLKQVQCAKWAWPRVETNPTTKLTPEHISPKPSRRTSYPMAGFPSKRKKAAVESSSSSAPASNPSGPNVILTKEFTTLSRSTSALTSASGPGPIIPLIHVETASKADLDASASEALPANLVANSHAADDAIDPTPDGAFTDSQRRLMSATPTSNNVPDVENKSAKPMTATSSGSIVVELDEPTRSQLQEAVGNAQAAGTDTLAAIPIEGEDGVRIVPVKVKKTKVFIRKGRSAVAHERVLAVFFGRQLAKPVKTALKQLANGDAMTVNDLKVLDPSSPDSPAN